MPVRPPAEEHGLLRLRRMAAASAGDFPRHQKKFAQARFTDVDGSVVSYVGVLSFASLVFLGAWKLAYWQGLLVAPTRSGTRLAVSPLRREELPAR